ncbi:hypothetical protein BB560_001116 [Smittium megazygosporum]|uniref:RING-type domain-containing protein n=1 Tax=Smittium megazygosporum TaxID=133381 RepID=A0A2T9ZIJ0_9FUNG|nr:hypothetical protein BB560_001116 [Smittium megazygosporum]
MKQVSTDYGISFSRYTYKTEIPNVWCFLSELVNIFSMDISLALYALNTFIFLIASFYRKLNQLKRAYSLSLPSSFPLRYPKNFFLFKFSVIISIFGFEVEDMIIWTACNVFILLLSEIVQKCTTHQSSISVTNKFPLFSIVSFVFVTNLLMLYVFWTYCFPFFSFFIIEGVLMVLDLVQVLIKYFSLTMSDNIGEYDDSLTDKLFLVQSILDIVILILGLAYFTIAAIINGFNINIPAIFTFSNIQSLVTRLNSSIRNLAQYKKALAQMNSVIVDATEENIKNYESVCPICWESFKSAIKLPCDHIFHRVCFRKWVEKHPKCPLCRVSIKGCEEYSNICVRMNPTDLYGAELIYSHSPPDYSEQRLRMRHLA